MFENAALTLRGRLVVLEPLAASHEPGLFRAAQDMDWSRMPVDPSSGPERFHEWLEDALSHAQAEDQVPFAVLAAGTRAPIGSTRYLALRPEHRGLEIGCIRVEFKTDARNARSRQALEALPAQFEGVFRKHMLVGNDRMRLRDSAWYAIVDDDWPEVKANLQQRLSARQGMDDSRPE